MDLQYAPRILERRATAAMEQLIAEIAQHAGVGLFRRFAMMQHWRAAQKILSALIPVRTCRIGLGFFRSAAQGFEQRKQVLYLLGPVGGGKSSRAQRLKQLMEKEPVYVLKAGKEISPVFESPLGLFDPVIFGEEIEKRYGVPKRRLTGTISPGR